MKIIYLHHADREKSINRSNRELAQLEDITENGKKACELLALKLENQKITAIITSPYLRCVHTAQIINKYHSVPIIEEVRFNEMDHYNKENYQDFLKRNIDAIDDITKKYSDDSVILCVTSGINISAFICYFYNIIPSDNTPWSQAMDLSPVSFTIGKWDL